MLEMKSYIIKLMILLFATSLGCISLTFGFDYKFTPETILIVTHYYGYNQKSQQEGVKNLIKETLLKDGKVIINYDKDSTIDLEFRREIQNKFTNFFDNQKLIFINSKVGEFINDTFHYKKNYCMIFETLGMSLYEILKKYKYRGFSMK